MRICGILADPFSLVSLMRFFEKLRRSLDAAISSFLVALFSLMLSLSALQIGLRYLFGTAIPWVDPAARNLVLWVGLLGAVLATGQTKHFRLDALTRILGPRSRAILDSLSELFAGGVCVFLVSASVQFITVGLDVGETAFLGIPVWVTAIIVPVGFGLMALQFALRFVDGIWKLRGPTSVKE
jgi:TRAP-type C4-dicarboxylate transport system permease small subunit